MSKILDNLTWLFTLILGILFIVTGWTGFLFAGLLIYLVSGIMHLLTPKVPKIPEKPVDNVPRETYIPHSDVFIEIGLNYETSDGLETGEIIEDHSKGHVFRFYGVKLRKNFDEYGNEWGGGSRILLQLPGYFLTEENKKMGGFATLQYRDAQVGDESNPLTQVFENGDWVPRWNENNIRSLERQAIPDALLAFSSDKIYRVPVVL